MTQFLVMLKKWWDTENHHFTTADIEEKCTEHPNDANWRMMRTASETIKKT